MARYYFINSQGTQIGPVERDDMLRFGITRDTLVWREGAPAWISAGQEPDLASYFASVPPAPPIPPVPPTPPVPPVPPTVPASTASAKVRLSNRTPMMSFRTVFHLPGSPVPGAEIGYNLKDCTTFFPVCPPSEPTGPVSQCPAEPKRFTTRTPATIRAMPTIPAVVSFCPKARAAITEVATMPTALQVA